MRVAGPFGPPVPEYPSLLRLHLPLIEPDLRDIIPPWSHASRPHLGAKASTAGHHRIYTFYQSDYSVHPLFALFFRVGSVRRSALCR
jgi:hypothetical protein